MKTAGKIKKFIVAAMSALCVFTLFSAISLAGVEVSKHNLSISDDARTPAYRSQFLFNTEQICVFCHTPHTANTKIRPGTFWNSTGYINTTAGNGSGQPMYLWNQALTNAGDYGGFTLYTSSSMDKYSGEVRVYSLMCLSCHDGVGAMNVLSNQPNDMWDDNADGLVDETGFVTPGTVDQIGDVGSTMTQANIGERYTVNSGEPVDTGVSTLSNDHPISIDYTDTHPDINAGGLATPDNVAGLIGGLRLFRNPRNASQFSSIECSTCHDVHNQGDYTTPYSTYPFLAKSNANSALCLTCHLK